MAGKLQLQQSFKKKYELQIFVREILLPVFGSDKLTVYSPENVIDETPNLTATESKLLRSAKCYGELNLDDDSQVKLYEIKLKPNVRLEYNKVSIQQYIRKLLLAGEGALINFVQPDNPSLWRLSLVASDAKHVDGKVQQTKLHAKRYTYLLGEHESCKTISERFADLEAASHIVLNPSEEDKNLISLVNAFSVEKLSKAFFDEYKEHYNRFCDYLQNSPYRTSVFNISFQGRLTPAEKDKLSKPIRDFVKKTLGRIVFLYFVQKKGWLGASNTEYSDGDTDFMMGLFKNGGADETFYYNYLQPLFFEALNTERKGDWFEIPEEKFMGVQKTKKVCVPFLNGGLFEQEEYDDHTLTFPPKLFHNPREQDNPKSRGFLDFLSAFNFTIYEDSPDDHTVAVDPEMLGHIFENLLEDNKDKGAYYTPKEIVHYMCQQSLLDYLITKLNVDAKESLEDFVKNKNLNAFVSKNAKEIDKHLDSVKICDPAIGSGAFPMGLLQEIFALRMLLFETIHQKQAAPAQRAAIRFNIIQNSIYGVDIEKGAVDIARLRFWLSLIVDEPQPKPLPNLDYKIVEGNSLMSKFDGEIIDIDWDTKGTNQYQKQIKDSLEELIAVQRKFFNAEGSKDKLKADIRRLKIEVLISQLTLDLETYKNRNASQNALFEKTQKDKEKELEIALRIAGYASAIKKLQQLAKNKQTLSFFDWHLNFPEILNPSVKASTGFDIVIGNPPYGAKMEPEEKEFCQKKFITAKTIKDVQKGSSDSYTLFIDLGYHLTGKNGNLHYIVPISVTSSESLTGVHKLLEDNCSVIRISSYSVRPQPVFENAVVNTSIVFFKKTLSKCENIFATKMYRKNKNFNLQHLVDNLEFLDVRKLKLTGRYPKISSPVEKKILSTLLSIDEKIGSQIKLKGKPIYYRFAGGRYYKVVTNYTTHSSAERAIIFDKRIANSIGAVLSSNLFFWWYQIFSDNLNLKSYEIEAFPFPLDKFTAKIIEKLEDVYALYLKDIEKNANVRQTDKYANIDSFKEYRIGKSKHLIDKIDDIIYPLFNLTKEEIEFIKKYEIEFRLTGEE